MSRSAKFLAIDLGASSGRVMLAEWDGQRFTLTELHRFANGPVAVMGHLHWDVLRLWQEIQAGIARYAAGYDEPLAGIGIDTWAVDFALLDSAGRMIGNPYHYRDSRTEGMPQLVDRIVPPQQLYAQTGIQRLPINTLYQLFSMKETNDPQLASVRTLLMIPDLFHYWLTGRKVAEYTNATTTNFYDPRRNEWAADTLGSLDLPADILPAIVSPGTLLGNLLPDVRDRAGLNTSPPVIATATHDTASAVAAIPGIDADSVYISSGTWSLVGVETAQPILTEQARTLNFTNEGGVGGTIRFLKNVGGLWLLQECQRKWEHERHTYTWPDLVALAEVATPLKSIVDPDSPEFLNPPDMQAAIQEYCRRTGQPEPLSVGEVVRCCLESLALKYRWVIDSLENLLGRRLDTIRIVGGGSRNALLCRLTADACERTVVAGPVEATALGNVLVQAVATGHISRIAAGREAIAASFEQTTYTPGSSLKWDSAYQRLEVLMQTANAESRGK